MEQEEAAGYYSYPIFDVLQAEADGTAEVVDDEELIPPQERYAMTCMRAAKGDLNLFTRLYEEERFSYVARLVALQNAANYRPPTDEEIEARRRRRILNRDGAFRESF